MTNGSGRARLDHDDFWIDAEMFRGPHHLAVFLDPTWTK
jgi:hypothetical protein